MGILKNLPLGFWIEKGLFALIGFFAGFEINRVPQVFTPAVHDVGNRRRIPGISNNAEWIIFCQKGRRPFNATTLLENRKKEGTLFQKERIPSKKYKTRFPACWFGPEYPKSTYNATWQRKHQIYHPTIKNVDCLSWLIQISSNPGDVVFDGFSGTASTAVAALTTGRHFLGAEISLDYWQIGQKRLNQYKEDE